MRALRTSRILLLAAAVAAQAAYAVPATATSQIAAVRGCVHHCGHARSVGEASRCCGVDTSATAPALLPAGNDLAQPVPALVAVLPGLPVMSASMAVVRLAPVAYATGPPLFLRLATLIR